MLTSAQWASRALLHQSLASDMVTIAAQVDQTLVILEPETVGEDADDPLQPADVSSPSK
jgi:hypothetical protein